MLPASPATHWRPRAKRALHHALNATTATASSACLKAQPRCRPPSSRCCRRWPRPGMRAWGGTLPLRGRSGSGKSTWLALMAGLRGASGGDLFVAGTQLGTQRGAEIDAWRARSIGFLPQKLYLSSALTVADNLALAYFAA